MVQIDTDTHSGATRLSVRGELDLMAAPAFYEALQRAARPGSSVEIDLAGVDFIDGSGLSMLMDAERRARRARHRLRIVAVSRYVRRLIDITDTAERVSALPTGLDGSGAERAT
jgi:anti-sigma B factor antagonist